jgi:hypothetical protein
MPIRMHSIPLVILVLLMSGCIGRYQPTLHEKDLKTHASFDLTDVVLTKNVVLERVEKRRVFFLSEKYLEVAGGSAFGDEGEPADVGCVVKGMQEALDAGTIIAPAEFWRSIGQHTETIDLISLFDEPYLSTIKSLGVDYLVVAYDQMWESESSYMEFVVEGGYFTADTEVTAAITLDMRTRKVIDALESEGSRMLALAHIFVVVPLVGHGSLKANPCQVAGHHAAEAINAAMEATNAPRIAIVAAKKNPYRTIDAEAQYIAALKMNDGDNRRRLRLLCRSADKGYLPARHLLGVYYEYGKYDLKKDPVRAYVWYRLASSGKSTSDVFVDRVEINLTETELTEALRRLNNWKPGQCEQDLDGTLLPGR